ncbi:hypothetical protein [Mycolicibacterium sp. XJ879]
MDYDDPLSDTTLFKDFGTWLSAADDPFPLDTVSAAEVFVDWFVARDNSLGAINEDDIVEYLLDWCPANMALTSEECHLCCASLGAFLEFLGDTGRLPAGTDRGNGLSHLALGLASAMHNTMTKPESDPKAILTHPGFNPPGKPRYIELLALPESMSEDEMKAELHSRMAEFKALPADEQAAIIEAHLRAEPEPVLLPFLYVPPTEADVESVAAAAPLLRKLEALRDYLGETGKTLTDRGNIKRADGKALIELLDTGDEMDPTFGERTFRTSTTGRLPGLNSIIEIAKKAGAVRLYRKRLVPVKSWSRASMTGRATSVYRAIIELGALGSRGGTYQVFDSVNDMLDGSTVHFLARILNPDTAVDLDELVEFVEPVLRDEIEPYWPQWSDSIESTARYGLSQVFQTLEGAGVVEWTDRRQVVRTFDTYPTGGTIRLTALGRYLVPIHLEEAGYLLRRVDDLAEAPASAFIAILDSVPDEDRQMVADSWQPGTDIAGRVQQIVEVLGAVNDPALQLSAFAALELFDAAIVGPQLRELLDGPVAGHAALYLLSRGLADDAEVRHLVDIGVFVDVLASSLDEPDVLCAMFSQAPHPADQYTALEQMWRHPSAQTAAVLDVLGQDHPDRKLAKAARKAAMRHRSWMASRD